MCCISSKKKKKRVNVLLYWRYNRTLISGRQCSNSWFGSRNHKFIPINSCMYCVFLITNNSRLIMYLLLWNKHAQVPVTGHILSKFQFCPPHSFIIRYMLILSSNLCISLEEILITSRFNDKKSSLNFSFPPFTLHVYYI